MNNLLTKNEKLMIKHIENQLNVSYNKVKLIEKMS